MLQVVDSGPGLWRRALRAKATKVEMWDKANGEPVLLKHAWMSACVDVSMRGCQHAWVSACVDVSMRGCQHAWMSACVDVSMRGCQHAWMSCWNHHSTPYVPNLRKSPFLENLSNVGECVRMCMCMCISFARNEEPCKRNVHDRVSA
jgi:hypothetical protein